MVLSLHILKFVKLNITNILNYISDLYICKKAGSRHTA